VHKFNLPKLLFVGLAAAAVTACGSSSSPSGSRPAANATAGTGRGNGVAGQLAQLNGSKLTLSGQNGVTTVTFSSSTRIVQTTTATFADIVAGACIAASGTKDASGTVTATTVTLMSKALMNGTCTPQGRNGVAPSPGRSGGGPRNRPSPGANRPSPPANFTLVRGQVASVNGSTVTVTLLNNAGTQVVTVPSTARITMIQPESASQLAVGQCITATGPKDSSGTVKATNLSIQPKGPTGCTFGRGGGGFFGGGGRAATPATQ
jgi:hypothetical protein